MDIFNPLVDLPMGLGMALTQDLDAMEHFAALSPDAQRRIIDQTHSIDSKSEMRAFVRRIAAGQSDL